MTTMNSELYNALKNAGANEGDARAAAESVAHGDEVATKTDLAQLQAATKSDLAQLETKITEKIAESDSRTFFRIIAVMGIYSAMTVAAMSLVIMSTTAG